MKTFENLYIIFVFILAAIVVGVFHRLFARGGGKGSQIIARLEFSAVAIIFASLLLDAVLYMVRNLTQGDEANTFSVRWDFALYVGVVAAGSMVVYVAFRKACDFMGLDK
jgi:hypothetical protein